LIRRAVDRLLDELERAREQTPRIAEAAAAYRTRAAAREAPADVRRTTMYLPDDTRRRLADAAIVRGKSQAELIREAVEEFLANAERPWPRSIGIGEDPELSGAEAKDWLRRTWAQQLESQHTGSARE
jgi:hypothetical protein